MNKIIDKLKTTIIVKTIKPKLTSKEKEVVELKKVNKLNKLFIKASPSEKRIIIAKDVINQINLGKYISKSGVYCEFNKSIIGDLQKHLLKPSVNCKVCAIGSLFSSSIRINDKYKISSSCQNIDNYPMMDELLKYFSEEQLHLIEKAYESWKNSILCTTKEINASNYRDRKKLTSTSSLRNEEEYKKLNKEALLSIMLNITKNKGTFRPER